MTITKEQVKHFIEEGMEIEYNRPEGFINWDWEHIIEKALENMPNNWIKIDPEDKSKLPNIGKPVWGHYPNSKGLVVILVNRGHRGWKTYNFPHHDIDQPESFHPYFQPQPPKD